MVEAIRIKFGTIALILQLLIVILFAVFGEYDTNAHPQATLSEIDLIRIYAPFQDINVMIFVGFGFLMTFAKRYGYSAVSINMFLASLIIQWSIIVRGFIYKGVFVGGKFTVAVHDMIAGNFASATVLISFGAVLGKTSPLQLLIMGMIEVVLAQINGWICRSQLHTVDVGESMYIHAFGAYFGLSLSWILYKKNVEKTHDKGESSYHSDLFSMIGTLFLWLFWPSFNGGEEEGDEMHRAFINTFLSLCACTVVTFALSGLYDKKGKFTMEFVQNSTLAGGVAVGTTANMPLQPYGAIIMGCVAGFISVTGFRFLKKWLSKNARIQDSCGVNNLHGMPAILAAVAGAVMAALASEERWGVSLYEIFPYMVPESGTAEFLNITAKYPKHNFAGGFGRTPMAQGGYQMLALVTTIGIAISGGIGTGLLLKIPMLDQVSKENELYDDAVSWNMPDEDNENKKQKKQSKTIKVQMVEFGRENASFVVSNYHL